MSVSFDVLVCAIPHRLEKLTRLLDELGRQGASVIVAYDNLERPWTRKCNELIAASNADYVAHVDDDDMVAPDYISAIMAALESEPDYVGFKVRWTKDGQEQRPVYHSLAYSGWYDVQDALYRDITDKNPIWRELALGAQWKGGNGADRDWAEQLRGKVKTEVFVNREIYYYQEESADTFLSDRKPFESLPDPPRREGVSYI